MAKCDDDMWYRYGFNTQEKDDEVYGKGNLNTAMFWEYDTRLGRRWNLDPKPRIGISDYSVMDGNPIIHIDIYGDRPSKRAAWAMAKVVYGKNDKATAKALKILQKEGWKVSGKDFGIKKESKEGFKSQVFERMVDEKSNKKEFAYATAGTETEDKKDMVNGNVKQLIGISPQYNLSTFNANSLSLSIGKSELSFVGHSLGGGLAAANAYATGREAITFNPSGLSNATICNIIINYGFKFMFARITAHVLLSDPLNIANTILLPGTNGNIRYHIPVDKKSWKDGHSIDNLGRSILKGW